MEGYDTGDEQVQVKSKRIRHDAGFVATVICLQLDIAGPTVVFSRVKVVNAV